MRIRKRPQLSLSASDSPFPSPPALSAGPATEEGKPAIAPPATTQKNDGESPKREDENPLKRMGAEASEKRKRGEGPSGGKGKKRRSPAVLMEGSRCSRVNGRGWRCYQQTLIGYSLCEHHLDKGRIRSVNSVRCKESVEEEDSGPGKNGNKKKTTKKKKIGMVKARSISSLLHQSELSTTAAVSAVAATSGGSGGEAQYICTR